MELLQKRNKSSKEDKETAESECLHQKLGSDRQKKKNSREASFSFPPSKGKLGSAYYPRTESNGITDTHNYLFGLCRPQLSH